MSYQLVVSEKPSVAMSYAKVLGATNRQDGYLEGNGYLVSWCVGHLVELAPPNVYDAKYVKWSIADLPILPQKWQYLVSASTKKQFGILQKLMHRPDVDSIVCATDAGREGELIFRLVYQQAGCKKPFSRLWLSSMEENAIREGFAHLKPSTEYDALYNAALCRERADWMVGINASRLFSCLYGQPLAVGRVMTPVLAMTVVREAAIAAFVPEKFYTVDLELTSGCTASSRRIPEKSVAENLLEACRREMVATIQRITRKEKSENPPPLYDLTTLQRDANRLLGYSAQQTLDYVQNLYEKKLTTYPRTDSCYITDDDEEKLEQHGYEIKRGKHTSVKGARQKRFIRFRTLGAGYSEDKIKAVIAGEAEHRPHQKQPPKEQPFHLLVDIQAKLSEGKSEGYARWAKRYNLKEMSKTLIFLQENKIGSIEEMQERVNAATAQYHELGDSIKAAEQRMAEIAVLRAHIINYAKTRPVYDAYRKAGYSKKFLEEHREQITLHRAAKATFDEAGLKKLPKVKELNTEYSTLLSQKKAAYPAYRKARDEMQELMKAQKNVEIFFIEEKATKEKAQTR